MSCKYFLTSKKQIQKRGDLAGNKAKNLATLFLHHINVPDFFVLSTKAFQDREYLLENPEILHSELDSLIKNIFHPVQHNTVAARSSATFEDSESNSHAGQLKTVLNLHNWEEILDATFEIWKATEKLKQHLKKAGISIFHQKVAIIIQKQIKSKVSGVLFTKHPLHFNSNDISIELVTGGCEQLVSGAVSPLQITVDRKTHEIKQKSGIDSDILTGFSSIHLQELIETGLAIERIFSSPQDIEWTFDGRTLWILQSRPITAYSSENERIVEDNDGLWTDYFFAERFVEPLSPLGWSYLQPIISKTAFKDPLWYLGQDKVFKHQKITKLINGMPHTRLSVFQTLYSLVPFTLISIDKKNALNLKRTNWALHILKSAPAILSRLIVKDFSWIPHANLASWRKFQQQLPLRLDELSAQATPFEELEAAFKKSHQLSLQFLAIHRWSITFADIFVSLFKTITNYLEIDDEQFSHFFQGMEENATLQANLALLDLDSNSPSSVESFMTKFGHRSNNLDIATPTWREQPEHVFQLAELTKQNSTFLKKGQMASSKAREEQIQQGYKLVQSMPLYKKFLFSVLFKNLLNFAQTFYLLRENQRNLWHQILAVSRQLALKMGDNLQERDLLDDQKDVFFFKLDELYNTGKTSDLRARIKIRKKERESFVSTIGSKELDKLEYIKENSVFYGIGVSKGKVQGKARVTKKYEFAIECNRDDILIIPSADPAWSPIFASISGLVMETGGILSHASIIAREFHLPTVTGVPRATQLIKTGDIVSIDGGVGTVEILHRDGEQH